MPARIAKHPIHPMLVPIPIGLWLFSFICDLVFVSGGGAEWQVVAFYNMVAGVIGALVAAIFGFIDMLSLEGERKTTALTHMTINLSVVVLYLINIWLRYTDSVSASAVTWLSLVSILLLVVSGWLGGKMVYVLGVAVDTGTESTPARTAGGARVVP